MQNVQVVFPGVNEVEIRRHDVGEIAPDRIVIRNRYTLVSPGTELIMLTGKHDKFSDPTNTWAKYPFYPGYAAVGRVVEAGGEVDGVEPGTMVLHGGKHQRYSTVSGSRNRPIPVPDTVNPALAVFCRLTQIAATALEAAQPVVGETVAVFGLGVIGNLAAQLYQAAGCRVIGLDPLPYRRQVAENCGVSVTCDPGIDGLADHLQETLGAKAVQTAIEATGVPGVIPQALNTVVQQGRVVLLGSPRGTLDFDPYNLVHRTGAHLVGAHERIVPPRRRREITADALAAIAEGRINPAPLITGRIPPSRADEVYRRLLTEPDKTATFLIDWEEL